MTSDWTIELVDQLLRHPELMVDDPVWQQRIQRYGGLAALQDQLRALPLKPHLRKLLELLLDDPQASGADYAQRLNVHRTTFHRHYSSLCKILLSAFTQARIQPLAPSPAPMAAAAPPLNLPKPASQLIGRSAELAQLSALIADPAIHLITMLGPGGVGKTRLALQLGWEQRQQQRVVWVELAPLTSAELVLPTIARSLGLTPAATTAELVTQIQAALAETPSLLILDNMEHVIAAATDIGHLLDAPATLTMLCTSRVQLGCAGECVVPVPSLSYALDAQHVSLADYQQLDAVALFLAHAQRTGVPLQRDHEQLALVQAICQQLDGLPLAIELAAAQVRQHTLAYILEQLEERFQLLQARQPINEPRHQTLWATIDWSYQLLDASAQQLFIRLGVFHGGWEERELQALCADWHPAETTLALRTLQDYQLVVRIASSSASRYGMLETIRAYCTTKLETTAEHPLLQQRHAQIYNALAQQETQHTSSSFTRLVREYDNLRAVLRWSHERAQPRHGVQLCGLLWRFWVYSLFSMEGWEWIERFRADVDSLDTELQAHYWHAYGCLAITHKQTYFSQGQQALKRSLALFEQLDERAAQANVLNTLGVSALFQEDTASAEIFYRRSLELYRGLEDSAAVARQLYNLGLMANLQQRLTEAEHYYLESLQLCEQEHNLTGLGDVYYGLGNLYIEKHEFAAARSYLTKTIELQQQNNHISTDPFLMITKLNILEQEYAQALQSLITATRLQLIRQEDRIRLYVLQLWKLLLEQLGESLLLSLVHGALARAYADNPQLLRSKLYPNPAVPERSTLDEPQQAEWERGFQLGVKQTIQVIFTAAQALQ